MSQTIHGQQNKDRLIFHIDVNSAFLSWEAMRRVKRGEPDIRLVPSIIGGDPTKRTSIVTAKSIPAKKLGIETGESVMTALRKCPDLIICMPDFSLYSKCSKAFKDICRSYAPVVEEFSIDECFLDMTGTSLMYPDPIQTAYEIKDLIKEKLGFTVNVGIGPNKLLAKMASDFEKPDKVHTLFYDEIPSKMWPLPVRDLLYCGKSSATRLESLSIKTIGDLANTDLSLLQSILGEKSGKSLHDSANGIDDSEVSDAEWDEKSYSIATTSEENIETFEDAERYLKVLAEIVTARMRKDDKYTQCVSVTIRYTDFKTRTHQRKLVDSTNISHEIEEEAVILLHEFWDGHTPLRLIGISLMDVTDEEYLQLSFFEEENRKKEKSKKLDHAMDTLRDKYGTGAVKLGAGLSMSKRVGRKYQDKKEDED